MVARSVGAITNTQCYYRRYFDLPGVKTKTVHDYCVYSPVKITTIGGEPTIVDIINGMLCVSYQIIRNHKECGGVLYPFDGYHFSFSFRYWP